MKGFIEFLKFAYDIFVPRFIQDDVCMWESDDGEYFPHFPVGYLCLDRDGEPDAMCVFQSFNLFGFALFPKLVGGPVSYREWLDSKEGVEPNEML